MKIKGAIVNSKKKIRLFKIKVMSIVPKLWEGSSVLETVVFIVWSRCVLNSFLVESERKHFCTT